MFDQIRFGWCYITKKISDIPYIPTKMGIVIEPQDLRIQHKASCLMRGISSSKCCAHSTRSSVGHGHGRKYQLGFLKNFEVRIECFSVNTWRLGTLDWGLYIYSWAWLTFRAQCAGLTPSPSPQVRVLYCYHRLLHTYIYGRVRHLYPKIDESFWFYMHNVMHEFYNVHFQWRSTSFHQDSFWFKC